MNPGIHIPNTPLKKFKLASGKLISILPTCIIGDHITLTLDQGDKNNPPAPPEIRIGSSSIPLTWLKTFLQTSSDIKNLDESHKAAQGEDFYITNIDKLY